MGRFTNVDFFPPIPPPPLQSHELNTFCSPIWLLVSCSILLAFWIRLSLVVLHSVVLVLVVIAVLQSEYVASNADLVEQGLQTVGSLADGNATNQDSLGELGACAGESSFWLAYC